MHLIQRYSLSCGAKIDKPFILPRFYPIPVDKFITFHPNSKYQSKNYDAWQQVLDIIYPVLKAAGYEIVQIGTNEDKIYKNVYRISGMTSLNQAAYVISHSSLHLGADSFAVHFASGFGKKIVSLTANNYPSVVKPYWNSPDSHVALSPDWTNKKPNFSAQESPKNINEIKPETVAKAVLKLLGLEYSFPYETLYQGSSSHNFLIENVPNQVLNPNQFGMDAVVVRMDLEHNETVLEQQLQQFTCCIVTEKPITTKILATFKPRIRELVYNIGLDNDPAFAKTIQALGLTHFLTSALEGEDLNKVKLDYLDSPLIIPRAVLNRNKINELKSLGKPLFYKTSKITLSEGRFYPCKAALKENKPISSPDPEILPIIDNDDFWSELDCFTILSTTNQV